MVQSAAYEKVTTATQSEEKNLYEIIDDIE